VYGITVSAWSGGVETNKRRRSLERMPDQRRFRAQTTSASLF
jgi:hypothetical protein